MQVKIKLIYIYIYIYESKVNYQNYRSVQETRHTRWTPVSRNHSCSRPSHCEHS